MRLSSFARRIASTMSLSSVWALLAGQPGARGRPRPAEPLDHVALRVEDQHGVTRHLGATAEQRCQQEQQEQEEHAVPEDPACQVDRRKVPLAILRNVPG